MVTNNHNINGCNKVNIHHQGKTIPATVISTDFVNDLALLKGEIKPTKIFALSEESPVIMQKIYVAGYPFGATISTSIKVTSGIISSLSGIGNNFSNMQIDAALQPGNSGGPIYNEKGNVVGVAVSKLNLKMVVEEFGVVPENTNFGIKSSVVANFLESNNIKLKSPNSEIMLTRELGETVTDATYFLSCWMTVAQIKKFQSQKVMFKELPQ